MGNRAVITFDKKPKPSSLGIYLHWNGGPESVLAFVEAADKLDVRKGDSSYEIARVVQIIGNYFGGTTSLGVDLLKRLDCANRNNGIYRVSRTAAATTVEQNKLGKLDGPWKKLDPAEVKKHPYWKSPDENGGNILEQVLDKNKIFFPEAYPATKS